MLNMAPKAQNCNLGCVRKPCAPGPPRFHLGKMAGGAGVSAKAPLPRRRPSGRARPPWKAVGRGRAPGLNLPLGSAVLPARRPPGEHGRPGKQASRNEATTRQAVRRGPPAMRSRRARTDARQNPPFSGVRAPGGAPAWSPGETSEPKRSENLAKTKQKPTCRKQNQAKTSQNQGKTRETR